MTADNNSSSINDLLLNNSSSFTTLIERVSQISLLQNKLRSELGHPMSEHLNVANFTSNSLTLHTDSPAWASRLRFNIQKIIKIARQKCGLDDLKSVRIKVVILEKDTTTTYRTLSLSENSSKFIDDAAASINDHNLKTALLKISKHHV